VYTKNCGSVVKGVLQRVFTVYNNLGSDKDNRKGG
jgi:hypothetical protein